MCSFRPTSRLHTSTHLLLYLRRKHLWNVKGGRLGKGAALWPDSLKKQFPNHWINVWVLLWNHDKRDTGSLQWTWTLSLLQQLRFSTQEQLAEPVTSHYRYHTRHVQIPLPSFWHDDQKVKTEPRLITDSFSPPSSQLFTLPQLPQPLTSSPLLFSSLFSISPSWLRVLVMTESPCSAFEAASISS